MQRSVCFHLADSEREAEEVDGVKENTGCVTDMSFLYTPEYFQQVFHMNRKAHSSTNEFFFFFFIMGELLREDWHYSGMEAKHSGVWLGSPSFAVKSTLILLIML